MPAVLTPRSWAGCVRFMPPVVTPTQVVELSVPPEFEKELPGWAPPQPEASAWQSPKGVWTHWEGDWWYCVDPRSSWWYWQKWKARARNGESFGESSVWSPDASQWPKPAGPKPVKPPVPEAGAVRPKVVALRPSDWQPKTPPVLVSVERLKRNELEDSPALVIQSLAKAAGVQASALLRGSWQFHNRGKQTSIVGHLRIREEIAEKVLPVSGERGVFVSLVGSANRVDPFWIRCLPEESRESYFLRVMALKRTRTQPVLHRPGGGHDLGFLHLVQDRDDKWTMHFTATGVPRAWDSTDVLHFMKSQGWTQLDQLTKRRNCWFFKALAPVDDQTSWRYIPEGDEAWCINVCLSTGQRKQAQVTQLSKPKPKLFAPVREVAVTDLPVPADAGAMELDDETGAPAEEDQSVRPTQLDEDAEADNRRGPRSCSPVRPVAVRSEFPPIDPSEAQSAGWSIPDLGGTGDGFFRALADVLPIRKIRPRPFGKLRLWLVEPS